MINVDRIIHVGVIYVKNIRLYRESVNFALFRIVANKMIIS